MMHVFEVMHIKSHSNGAMSNSHWNLPLNFAATEKVAFNIKPRVRANSKMLQLQFSRRDGTSWQWDKVRQGETILIFTVVFPKSFPGVLMASWFRSVHLKYYQKAQSTKPNPVAGLVKLFLWLIVCWEVLKVVALGVEKQNPVYSSICSANSIHHSHKIRIKWINRFNFKPAMGCQAAQSRSLQYLEVQMDSYCLHLQLFNCPNLILPVSKRSFLAWCMHGLHKKISQVFRGYKPVQQWNPGANINGTKWDLGSLFYMLTCDSSRILLVSQNEFVLQAVKQNSLLTGKLCGNTMCKYCVDTTETE